MNKEKKSSQKPSVQSERTSVQRSQHEKTNDQWHERNCAVHGDKSKFNTLKVRTLIEILNLQLLNISRISTHHFLWRLLHWLEEAVSGWKTQSLALLFTKVLELYPARKIHVMKQTKQKRFQEDLDNGLLGCLSLKLTSIKRLQFRKLTIQIMILNKERKGRLVSHLSNEVGHYGSQTQHQRKPTMPHKDKQTI